MRDLRVMFLFTLVAALYSPRAWGDYLERVGGFGGACNAVALYGDYAYAGEGTNLCIYSIANPAAPRLLDRIFLPDTVMNIAINEDIAYVADQSGGLFVYSLTIPQAPKLVNKIKYASALSDIALAGPRLLAVMGCNLYFLDLSNPYTPAVTGSFKPRNYIYYYHNVSASERLACTWGQHKYVQSRSDTLTFIDITDTSRPVVKSDYQLVGTVQQFILSPTRAYFTCNTWIPSLLGFNILDIADPSSPTLIGHYTLKTPVGGLAIRDRWAFMTDATGLKALDISDPAKPILKGAYATAKPAVRILDVGERSVLMAPGASLAVLDLSNPATPLARGSCRIAPDNLSPIALSGSLALVGSYTCGLQAWDISNPRMPLFKGALDSTTSTRDIRTSGTMAYLAGWTDGLQVVDFSNPTALKIKSTYRTGGKPIRLRLRSRQALVADYQNGLEILDLSDPTSLTRLGRIAPPHPPGSSAAYDVETTGSYAYLSAYDCSYVIDIAKPAAPVIKSSFDTYANCFALGGAKLFGGRGNVYIYDITDPTSPTLEQRLTTSPSPENRVADALIAYPLAFFTCDVMYPAILVYDISNPGQPVLKCSVDANNYPNRLAYSAPYLLCAEYSNGVRIFRIREGSPPSRAGEAWTLYP